MFGFSLQKLLVLAAIVAAVWYGFQWLSRLDRQRKAERQPGWCLLDHTDGLFMRLISVFRLVVRPCMMERCMVNAH